MTQLATIPQPQAALAATPPAAVLPAGMMAFDIPSQVWNQMWPMAKALVASGVLPNAVKTQEAAFAIMLKGRELRVPPMQAFAMIHIINGKPTIAAELMMTLIYRDCPGAKIEYTEMSNDAVRLTATRPGHKPMNFAFTMKDAEQAKLTGKDVWKSYPRAMLRSRCIAEMARALFPDCLAGCSYTPEELDVPVNEHGEVLDTTARQAPPPPKPAPAAELKPEDIPFGPSETKVEETPAAATQPAAETPAADDLPAAMNRFQAAISAAKKRGFKPVQKRVTDALLSKDAALLNQLAADLEGGGTAGLDEVQT